MRISDWSSDVCSSDLYYRGDPLLGDWIKRGAMAGAAVVALLVLTILRRGPSLHGRARFAREGEIRSEGLRAPSGIVVGRKAGRLLIFGGNEHEIGRASGRERVCQSV